MSSRGDKSFSLMEVNKGLVCSDPYARANNLFACQKRGSIQITLKCKKKKFFGWREGWKRKIDHGTANGQRIVKYNVRYVKVTDKNREQNISLLHSSFCILGGLFFFLLHMYLLSFIPFIPPCEVWVTCEGKSRYRDGQEGQKEGQLDVSRSDVLIPQLRFLAHVITPSSSFSFVCVLSALGRWQKCIKC